MFQFFLSYGVISNMLHFVSVLFLRHGLFSFRFLMVFGVLVKYILFLCFLYILDFHCLPVFCCSLKHVGISVFSLSFSNIFFFFVNRDTKVLLNRLNFLEPDVMLWFVFRVVCVFIIRVVCVLSSVLSVCCLSYCRCVIFRAVCIL